MINIKRNHQDSGNKLKKLRKLLNLSRKEMAARLGLTRSGYTRNENGDTFPGKSTLRRLSKDFDISMDWLFFDRGPMYFQEKLPEEKEPPVKEQEEPPREEEEKRTPRIEEVMPDVRELLDHMEQDPLLRYEMLLTFYKYKKETQKPVESPAAGGHDDDSSPGNE
jgi:transcriptional regulator with XRE-family HTH domain